MSTVAEEKNYVLFDAAAHSADADELKDELFRDTTSPVAAMLHPDKQHRRDAVSRRRTALAWQRVSEAYDRVMPALGADAPDG